MPFICSCSDRCDNPCRSKTGLHQSDSKKERYTKASLTRIAPGRPAERRTDDRYAEREAVGGLPLRGGAPSRGCVLNPTQTHMYAQTSRQEPAISTGDVGRSLQRNAEKRR